MATGNGHAARHDPMDSDAGGFTADDRAEAIKMLESSSLHANANDSDSDSDIGEDDFFPPPPSQKPPPPQAPPQARPVGSQPPRGPPPARPVGPAPPSVSNAGRRPERVDRASYLLPESAVPGTPLAGRSQSPCNDEEDGHGHDSAHPPPQAKSGRTHMPRGIPAVPAVRAARPVPRSAPALPSDPSAYTIPATPNDALARFDECMNYLVEMLCQLTGSNANAVTAKQSLEIFRMQMLSWHGDVENEDWEKASKSMVMFAVTVRMVIHATVQRTKDQRAREMRQPIALPGQSQSQSRSVPAAHSADRVLEAIPRAIPTDAESTDSGRIAPPIGMHYNAAKLHHTSEPSQPSHTEPAPARPDYIVQADLATAPPVNDGCTIS